jgi:transposase
LPAGRGCRKTHATIVLSADSGYDRPITEDGMGSKKRFRTIGRGQQESLFDDGPQRDLTAPARATRASFIDPNPHEIVLGGVRLDEFLRKMGQDWIIEARALLQGLDWSAFEDSYASGGRSGYAPRSMVGLILFGVMQGKSSLREVEELARCNVGAMWMSGGIFPDHSVLGRFIQRHECLLTEAFFESLTRLIVTKLGSSCVTVAGDGTVIEAAASRFQSIKLSALQERVAALDDAVGDDCDDEDDSGDNDDSGESDEEPPALEGNADEANKFRRALSIAEPRIERSHKKREKKASTRVNLQDPESVYLKQKRGGFRFSYVVSYLVNADRFIVACATNPSDELCVVPKLLDQACRVASSGVERVLLDANYHRASIFQAAIDRELDLLTPPPDSSSKPFHKSNFIRVDEDHLRCLAGHVLRRQSETVDKRNGKVSVQYRIASPDICKQCEHFGKCTKSPRGRSVVHDETEWAREAVITAMKNPVARELYNQRIATVEPTIGELRQLQRFNRFARNGESGSALETSLMASAFNLRRYARKAAAGRSLGLFIGLCGLIRGFWNTLNDQKPKRPRQQPAHLIANRTCVFDRELSLAAP